ncbi:SusC/RagA family TonB-linked outer membrane protein [Deminuibacter soli]|uniref:SusC/RagA family TonB-linked outer membrane protein n=1 Tax=Deminuibacter soli TaxID=2291815 RepID=A0A3E1NGH1_9BACT|nr:SusC/RagA family TonB-linked outer membrane protein [Deminuibacter soli]RFM27063.1 SusC/RagA family TonB-linked outer membrane protein [Deminuibacter soli]
MNLPRISTMLLLLCLCSALLLKAKAQSPGIQVHGSVKNEKGEPVDYVSVRIAGTEKGTVSDAKGNFTLTAPADAQLQLTHIGYDTLLVKAAAQLSVTLTSNASPLNDVVVIGYGTARRKEVTGAIATVTAKDFQQGSITTPEQLIAGKVAGVSITSNSGSPGAGSTIRIRGGASLNASNDPLIVIDGVPLSGNNIYGASNSLSLINPNDIESFTVLKDAASTAIYGSRASNGVIIITTKKGTRGTPTFSFSTQVSAATLAKKMDVQSAAEFRSYVDSLGGGTFDNTHTYKSLLGSANTDWQKEIYQTAISTDNNLSVSGALKNMPYRFSVGYLNQDGLLKTDNLQRISAGISLSPRLLDNHLKIDLNLKGAYNKTRFANNAAISSAAYFDPTQPVHAASPYGNYFEWASVDAASGDVTLNKLAPRNPVALLELYNNRSTVQRSYGNIQFDYSFHFLPELHANLNLGYDIAKGDGKIDVPAYAAQNFLDGGQHNQYANKIGNKVGEFYLNYTKDIKPLKSNVNVTAGYGYYNNLTTNYNYPAIRANGDTIPGSIPLYKMDKPENTLISYYGRLIYTYDGKYIVAASIRSDGSSRFAPATRWGTFPSVAFTWRVNKESFLENAKALSDLKLRLSYGVTGNQDGIYNYPYQSVYSLSGNGSAVQFGDKYYYMGTPAAYDAGIKWEQTSSYNAGVDYGFLNNRISGSFDFYYKKTKDLLNTIPIPSGSNFSSTILTNVGNVENKGVEMAINATVLKTAKYSWDIGFNASYNQNKITNLTATKDSTYPGTLTGNGIIQINSVGYQANSFYVYHQQYRNGKPVEGVFADINGDGIINQNDLYRYKSPFPKFVLGFTTQFTYGKWAVNTVLRANIGNYMYNGIATGSLKSNILNPLGYLANSLRDVYNTQFVYGQSQSDYYIENASFLKMDNLGVAYTVGRILNNKVGLRLNANCQNVFTITRYKGLDPEIYGGIDNTIYPRPRTFVLGASLQF